MTLRTAPAPLFVYLESSIGEWVSDTVIPVSYSDFINNEKLEIKTPEPEIKKLISRMASSVGATLDSQAVPTDKSATVTLTSSTFTPTLLALALGANVTEVTQTAAAVANETVNTLLGLWVKLANRAIAAPGTGTEITLKTSADAAVTSDKYKIDLVRGMIMALHADAVGAGMKLSYHTESATWESYNGGLIVTKYVHISGIAKDMVSQRLGDLDIWRVNLVPASTFDPTGGDYLKADLTGDMIVPSVAIDGAIQTAPYRFRPRKS